MKKELTDEFVEAMNLVAKKNQDYGNAKDVMGEVMFRLLGQITLEKPEDYQEFGIINLIFTKVARMSNLWARSGKQQNFESIQDTLLDLGNYAFILKNMINNKEVK